MPERADAVGAALALPGIDDPPSTEVGIVLLGLGGERLLAGLAVATDQDDAGQVAVTVERARHGAADTSFDDLVADGTRRWRIHRRQLPAAGPEPGSVRQAWLRTQRSVAAATQTTGATRDYLAALWLRRSSIDTYRTDTDGESR